LALALEPVLGSIASALFAVGSGLMMPPLQSLTTRTVAPELRGGILGVYQSVINLSIIISTAIAGTLFAINPTIPYWFSGVLVWLSMIPGVFLWRWSRKAQMEQASATKK